MFRPAYSRARVVVLVCALAVFFGQPAAGLIITTDQNLGDTASPPVGFQYWDNVGWRGTQTGVNNDGSCVYLGNSWVLTANHVGNGNVILGGVTYAPIEGTSQRVGTADARVFRIANPSPSLQPVSIYDGDLTIGTEVRMFGTGLDQDPDKTYWRVTSGGSGVTWTEVSKFLADASGYYWGQTRIKRWGTNEICDVYQYGSDYFFETSFDEGDTEYEANGADKDSGGPAFVHSGGSWTLAGIVVSLTGWQDQPEAAIDWVDWYSTSGNRSVFVDLTQYRDLIISLTPLPEPIPGDLNLDDYVSQQDLDIVLDHWGQSVGPDHQADPSGDGFVGQADLDTVLYYWGSGTPPP